MSRIVFALVLLAGCTGSQSLAAWSAIDKVLTGLSVGCSAVEAASPFVDAIRDASGHKVPTIGGSDAPVP